MRQHGHTDVEENRPTTQDIAGAHEQPADVVEVDETARPTDTTLAETDTGTDRDYETDRERETDRAADTDYADTDRSVGTEYSDTDRSVGAGTAGAAYGEHDTADGYTDAVRPTDMDTTRGEHDATSRRDGAADVLFDEAEAGRFRERWHEVQAEFVDDPKQAVQDADVLVAELMQAVASAFSERKQLLEHQWREGATAETEDLRLALRGYRSFLDQLLAH
jgi:hypothetical protein